MNSIKIYSVFHKHFNEYCVMEDTKYSGMIQRLYCNDNKLPEYAKNLYIDTNEFKNINRYNKYINEAVFYYFLYHNKSFMNYDYIGLYHYRRKLDVDYDYIMNSHDNCTYISKIHKYGVVKLMKNLIPFLMDPNHKLWNNIREVVDQSEIYHFMKNDINKKVSHCEIFIAPKIVTLNLIEYILPIIDTIIYNIDHGYLDDYTDKRIYGYFLEFLILQYMDKLTNTKLVHCLLYTDIYN